MAGAGLGGEGALMITYSNTTAPEGEKPPSFGIGKLLFAVVLAVIFFLLAQSMLRHRFFKGRRVNQPTTQTPIPIGP
jgi:hypothetical protein